MTRERALRHRLASLATLGEAVNAMKSLSAHHLRSAREGLPAARAYRDGIDALAASAEITQIPPHTATPGLLLIAADLGLCDGYTPRLTQAALEQRRQSGATALYCVGRRPLQTLRREGIPVTATYAAVSSVTGITNLLLVLADDVLGAYLKGAFGALRVVSARFDGVGAFTPVTTQVLPIAPTHTVRQPAARPYVSAGRLARVAIREYLYSTLYGLLLDALASEHGMRLIATQSAGQWLDSRVDDLRRRLSSLRREAGTQEVLEVAAGARQRARANRREGPARTSVW